MSQTESNISSRALEQYEAIYLCPITQELMVNPADLPCGHTFEYEEIKKVVVKFGECPLCKEAFQAKDIKRNLFAKQSIQLHLKNVKKKENQKKQEVLKKMQELKIAEKSSQPDLPFEVKITQKSNCVRQNPYSLVKVMLTPKQAAVYDEIIEMQTQYRQHLISDSDSDDEVSYIVRTQKVYPVKVRPQDYVRFNKARDWFRYNFMDIYMKLID